MHASLARSAAVIVVSALLTAGTAACTPPTEGTDPLVGRVLEATNSKSGQVGGYLIDLRLRTKTGPATLELVVLTNGQVMQSPNWQPAGAWDTTPTSRLGSETRTQQASREQAQRLAAQTATSFGKRSDPSYEVTSTQVFGYVISVTKDSGEIEQVLIPPDGTLPNVLESLKPWPPTSSN